MRIPMWILAALCLLTGLFPNLMLNYIIIPATNAVYNTVPYIDTAMGSGYAAEHLRARPRSWTARLTAIGAWSPISWLLLFVIVLAAVFLVLAHRHAATAPPGCEPDSKHAVFFGGEEAEYSHISGGDLFWGFKHNLRHYLGFMSRVHTGVTNDYVLWGVTATGRDNRVLLRVRTVRRAGLWILWTSVIYAVYILIFPGAAVHLPVRAVARRHRPQGRGAHAEAQGPAHNPAGLGLPQAAGQGVHRAGTAARATFLAAPYVGLASLVVTVLFIPIGGSRPSAERRHGGHPLPADHTHAGHDTRRQRLRLALRGRGRVAHDGRHHELRAPADTRASGRGQSAPRPGWT